MRREVPSLLLALGLALAGCEGMPDIAFVPDGNDAAGGPGDATVTPGDGSTTPLDATAPPPDGASSPEAGPDAGGKGDASGGGQDSGGGGGCPGTTPTGATACCNAVPCVDHQNQGNCLSCAPCNQRACGPKGVCCFDAQGVLSCRPNTMACKA